MHHVATLVLYEMVQVLPRGSSTTKFEQRLASMSMPVEHALRIICSKMLKKLICPSVGVLDMSPTTSGYPRESWALTIAFKNYSKTSHLFENNLIFVQTKKFFNSNILFRYILVYNSSWFVYTGYIYTLRYTLELAVFVFFV